MTTAVRVGAIRVPAARVSSLHREGRAAYLFLAPSLLFFCIFLILPFLFAIVLAFSDWGGFDLGTIEWAGVRNFSEVLSFDGAFVKPILVNTLLFAFGSVLLATVGSVLVAHCIEQLHFQGFWRVLYFLPVVATVVAIGNVWKMMYQPAGLINGVLNKLGVNSVGFLSDASYALPSVTVVHAWASIGGAVLILTAGLKSIPDMYYEAAAVDGATPSRMFWQITLPLLRPSLLFVLITQFIGGLQSFALIIVMTGDGGPVNATNVAAFEMYQQAFKFGAWGTAGGLTTSLLALILLFTVSGFGIFLMRQFMVSLPDEMLEAARIDGANQWQTWRLIVLPQTKPVAITLGLITFIGMWNEYIWTLLISSSDPSLQTLPVGIQLLQSFLDPDRTMPIVMAGLVVSTLPVLVVFLLFQKYYVRGVVLSGLK